MSHVTYRIIDLALVQRAAGPIGKARALVESDAKPAIDEIRIADLLALPQRHRRNLRVEQRVGGLAGQVIDNFDVLRTGMEDLEDILIVHQQVEQRTHVQPVLHRIDCGGFVRIGDLDQAEFGPIAVFPHKFGIDRNEWRFGQTSAEIGESGGILDQRVYVHLLPIATCIALTNRRCTCVRRA